MSQESLECPPSQPEENDSVVDRDEDKFYGRTVMEIGFSFTRIKKCLQDTKGFRMVKVEKFFPDLKLFLESISLYEKHSRAMF